jgi:hypothetical protein
VDGEYIPASDINDVRAEVCALETELLNGGWLGAAAWTYASPTSFTVAGDQTSLYSKGTFLKCMQASLKYGVVAASSYSSPNTTVSILANSNYSLENAAISLPATSRMANPAGWPDWFNYSCATGGLSGMPVVTARYRVQGKMICLFLDISGTSNATSFTASAPVANFGMVRYIGGFRAMDNNVVITATVPAFVLSANSTLITFYTSWGAAPWTASGTKSAQISLFYEY